MKHPRTTLLLAFAFVALLVAPLVAPLAAAAQEAQPPAATDAAVTAIPLFHGYGYVLVNASGSTARKFRVTSTAHLAGAGTYEVIFPGNVRSCAYQATIGLGGSTFIPPSGFVSTTARNGNLQGVFVLTRDTTGTPVDLPFFLTVNCTP